MSFGAFLLYFLFITLFSTKIFGIARKKPQKRFNISAISSIQPEQCIRIGTTLLYFFFTMLSSAKIFCVARKKRQQRFNILPISSVRPEQSIRKYIEQLRDLKLAAKYFLAILCSIVCHCFFVVTSQFRSIEGKAFSESTASLNGVCI